MTLVDFDLGELHLLRKFAEQWQKKTPLSEMKKGQKIPDSMIELQCLDLDTIESTIQSKKSLIHVRISMNLFERNGYTMLVCDGRHCHHQDEEFICQHLWATLNQVCKRVGIQTKKLTPGTPETSNSEILQKYSENLFPLIAHTMGHQQSTTWVLDKSGNLSPWVKFWHSNTMKWSHYHKSEWSEDLINHYPGHIKSKLTPFFKHFQSQKILGNSAQNDVVVSFITIISNYQLPFAWLNPKNDHKPVVHEKLIYQLDLEKNGCRITPSFGNIKQPNDLFKYSDGLLYQVCDEKKLVHIISIPSRLDPWLNHLLNHKKNFIPWEKHFHARRTLLNIQRLCKITPVHQIQIQTSLHKSDYSIHLRVRPHEFGVVGTILISEFKGLGDFIPAIGPEQIYDITPTQIHITNRDLTWEQQAKNKIIKLAQKYHASMIEPNHIIRWDEMSQFIEFLSDLEALKLEKNGTCTIQWPEDIDFKPKVTNKNLGATPPLTVEVKQGNDWFEMNGGFHIDGIWVSLQTLLKALLTGQRYLQIGPQKWLHLAESLKKQLESISSCLRQNELYEPSNLDQCQENIPILTLPDIESSEHQSQVSKYNQTLEQEINRYVLKLEAPDILTTQLYAYQKQGIRWLIEKSILGLGCILADDMGLGKTLQTIASLVAIPKNRPHLVVAPTSLVFNWQAEITKFTPHLNVINAYSKQFTQNDLHQVDIVIASYGTVAAREQVFTQIKWDTLILDEAQKIKNSNSNISKIMKQLQTRHKIGLSGTPLENNLSEIWSLFHVLQPELLGSQSNFKKLFEQNTSSKECFNGVETLKKRIQPFILRRLKEHHLSNLPKKIELNCPVYLYPQERQKYDRLRMEAIAYLAEVAQPESQNSSTKVLQYLQMLRTWCCIPNQIDPSWTAASSKETAFIELFLSLYEKERRCLVFSQFPRFLNKLQTQFNKEQIPSFLIDGNTSTTDRESQVNRFQNGERSLFFISLKAGGVGLNLTGADSVIHLDPWWNPALEDQASARAYRIGQDKNVSVYRFFCPSTIEEKILNLHSKKRDLATSVLAPPKQQNQDLTEHCKELLSE